MSNLVFTVCTIHVQSGIYCVHYSVQTLTKVNIFDDSGIGGPLTSNERSEDSQHSEEEEKEDGIIMLILHNKKGSDSEDSDSDAWLNDYDSEESIPDLISIDSEEEYETYEADQGSGLLEGGH